MFTTALGIFTLIAHNLWVLLVALIPAILGFCAPLLKALVDGLSAYLSTFWEGLKSMSFPEWLFSATVAGAAFGLGYWYGWDAAIAWGHEHFRWVAKLVPSTHWWKFW